MGKSLLSSNLGENLIINPLMDFWQRGTSIVSPTNLQYLADRWRYTFAATTGLVTVSRSTNVPDKSIASYSMRIQVTTADATLGATDHAAIEQPIEGLFIRKIYNRKSKFGFYVRSNKLGLYSVSFRNTVANRAYVSKFNITSADEWVFVEIPIAAIDTTIGTWAKDNTVGLIAMIKLMEGRAANTTSNEKTWETGNYQAFTGQVNFMDTIGNYLEVTEFQLVEGNELYPAQEIMRDFPKELQLCQRYFEKSYALDATPGSVDSSEQLQMWAPTTISTHHYYSYKVRKRDTPVLTFWNQNGALNQWYDTGSGTGRSVDGSSSLLHGFKVAVTPAAINRVLLGHFISDAEL